ncbi:MAG: phage terminase large subunit [Anaeroplasma sp.]
MMQPIFELSSHQWTYVEEACHEDPTLDHRWNIKSGATQCGKTTLDFMFTIPFRIQVRSKLPGAIAILGVTLGTIERNVLEPMREYFHKQGTPMVIGDRVRKDATGNSYIRLYGQKVYLCGMLDKKAISRLRGAKFKYVYCDELAEYNKDAFELLKSRLSLPYSCCDGACNPESDTHWLYEFINSDVDIYLQHYTIFDNPFLSQKYVDELCKEYSGTVYYDRYILGKWAKAEGLIYRKLADNPEEFILDVCPKIASVVIGVDFGGNKSAHAFTATGIGPGFEYVVFLESKKIPATGMDPTELTDEFESFVNMVKKKYGVHAIEVYCDSAEQTLMNGFRNRSLRNRLGAIIKNAIKSEIADRIKLITRLLGTKRLFFMRSAKSVLDAFRTCVYNSKEGHEDERLDDGATDIDSVDSGEYTIEPFADNLLIKLEMKSEVRLWQQNSI